MMAMVISSPNIGYKGVLTLRHQDTSAPVPKCLGHFGTDHRGSHACQGSYVVDGEGSLKQSTFMCRFL